MKKQILSIFIFTMTLSVHLQAQDNPTEEALAKTIMDAILQDDMSKLEEYQPTTDLLKSLYPEMAGEMTDEELKDKFLMPLAKRFQGNIDNIQAEIKEEKIDLEKIKFKEYSIEKMSDNKAMPSAMSIQFYYGESKESVPVTIMEVEGKWYIFEILVSEDVFNG